MLGTSQEYEKKKKKEKKMSAMYGNRFGNSNSFRNTLTRKLTAPMRRLYWKVSVIGCKYRILRFLKVRLQSTIDTPFKTSQLEIDFERIQSTTAHTHTQKKK